MKMNATHSDTDLIPLLRKKDREACAYLFEKYGGALNSLIKDILPHDNTGSDLLKHCFIDIFQNIDSYDPAKSRLFTWMLQRTRQHALQKLRSVSHRTLTVPDHVSKESNCLSGLVTNMATGDRELINMSYFEGCSAEDMATRLNLPVEAVNKSTRLALLRLNASL